MTWLVPPDRRRLTPNRRDAGDPRVRPVEGIVYHYTAGAFAGSVAWLCDPRSQASAHFVISKAGEVVQLASLDDRTWHAGVSTFRGRGMVNERTWGIEIENFGPTAAGWDPYTEEQLVAAVVLTRDLVARMPNVVEVRAAPQRFLVGHEHVAPTRKKDPGPAFPWGRIYAAARSVAAPVTAGGDASSLPPEGLMTPVNGMCGGDKP